MRMENLAHGLLIGPFMRDILFFTALGAWPLEVWIKWMCCAFYLGLAFLFVCSPDYGTGLNASLSDISALREYALEV